MSNSPVKPFGLTVSFPVHCNTPIEHNTLARATFSVPSKSLLLDKEGAALLADFFADLSLVLGKDTTDEHLEKTFKELNESHSILPIPEGSDNKEVY